MMKNISINYFLRLCVHISWLAAPTTELHRIILSPLGKKAKFSLAKNKNAKIIHPITHGCIVKPFML